MITAITFTDQWNKKYYHPDTIQPKSYGESPISSLAEELANNAILQEKIGKLVTEINADLNNANIADLVKKHFPKSGDINKHTRVITLKKRRYFVFGLTIHEEDI